ncbi:MAG: cytochrome c [Gammaproteobacteria bacterium]
MLSRIALACAAGLLLTATAHAGDAEAGKAKSATCSACHGASGVSPNPIWPNLAGQKDQYLIAQMKAFRDGARKNPMMSPMAAPLSDADIENLAAYYSSLSCQ